MRLRRIVALAAAIALTGSVAIATPLVIGTARQAWHDYENRPHPIVASDEETRAMVQAILAHERFKEGPLPPAGPGQPAVPRPKRDMLLLDQSLCLVDDETVPRCGSSEDADDVIHLTNVPAQWKREMLHANRTSRAIDLSGIASTRVIRQADITEIFAGKGWWEDFYARYPQTAGFAAVSVPVLSKDRKQALVYFAHYCGGLCAGGDIFVLQREGRGWEVVEVFGLWVS